MTRAIVKDALKQGKRVFVPWLLDITVPNFDVDPASSAEASTRKVMNMVELYSREDYKRCENNRDVWGIPTIQEGIIPERRTILEPNIHDRVWLDMIVMPGLAFDGNLARLGHGKGFYDRFLNQYHDATLRIQRHKPALGT